jgi:diguanylate cyclase (GGDEF)-like protein/PAS domain S-box-containing protein
MTTKAKPADGRAPARLSTLPAAKPSVLVVDDEPQVLVALEDILSEQFTVRTASSAEQALMVAAEQQDLAVVISDQRMPEMSGDELFGRLAEGSQAERIMVTGFSDITAVIRAVNEGRIFAYITKPWDAEDLQQKVYRAAEHFQLARELAYERQLLEDLMENIPDGIYFKDPQLRFLKANAPVARLLNYSDPAELVGRRLCEVPSVGTRARETEAEEQRIIRDGTQVVDVIREYGEASEPKWFSETKVAVRGSGGAILGLVGISRDVTDRVEADNARERQQRRIARLTRIHAVLSGINSAIVRTDDRDKLLNEACRIAITEGQLAFATVVAYEAAEQLFQVVAVASDDAAAPHSLPLEAGLLQSEHDILSSVVSTGAPVVENDTLAAPSVLPQFWRCDCRAIAAFPLLTSGKVRFVFALSSSQPDFFDSDEVRLLTNLADNISFALTHIAAKQRLDFLAYYDELTGLPNRRLLFDRLTQQLVATSTVARKLALVMIDVNRFRQINETLGRDGGDALLCEVSALLRLQIDDQDTLARVDGNRFAMLIPLVEDETDVAARVERLLTQAMNQSIRIGDVDILVSGRCGISLFPSDGKDADTLVSNAEAAAKKAKSLAQRYVFYAPSMNDRVAEQLSLEARLKRALDNEEFVLHYQPKVDLRSGGIAGLEALIRWQDPEQGLVAPGVFIPVLEETGLIMDVGQWVLLRAAAQHAEWAKQGRNPPRIAVNVSALQLGQPGFLDSIERVMSEHGQAARCLDLEITESVFVDDFEGNVRKLAQTREWGFQVAIDDFGTGYSSLAYLTRLPIDVLKIDRSFVARMTDNPQDMALVTTVISLAHALDCEVVAEGVELPDQAKLLHLLRCDHIQGYLIARPLPATEIVELFHQPQSLKWK